MHALAMLLTKSWFGGGTANPSSRYTEHPAGTADARANAPLVSVTAPAGVRIGDDDAIG